MKAPDEIYLTIHQGSENEFLSDLWWKTPQRNSENIKYIRADLVEKILSAQRQIDAGMPKDPTFSYASLKELAELKRKLDEN